MSATKTAATVLQELMVKLGENPHYECTAQSGLQHQCMFEYRVTAHGAVGVASARSKKEARQEAARVALAELARLGHPVPPPYNYNTPFDSLSTSGMAGATASTSADVLGGPDDVAPPTLASRNAVALLRDLGEEYRLGDAEYELVGDTGPPHLRHFTMRASLRGVSRTATATTKKAARQLAAHQLYTYFKEHLQRLTGDYDEAEALVRAHERAMERYPEAREHAARPRLTQCIADYHLGLKDQLGVEKASAIVAALQCMDPAEEPVDKLLAVQAEFMPQLSIASKDSQYCLELAPAAPPLVFNGDCPRNAAALALRYLALTLDDWC